MTQFAVEWLFTADEDSRLATRPAHREYLRGLVNRGVLLASGPWADDTGALLIYQVEDRDALGRILAEDPYTAAGVISDTRIHEWKIVTGTGITVG